MQQRGGWRWGAAMIVVGSVALGLWLGWGLHSPNTSALRTQTDSLRKVNAALQRERGAQALTTARLEREAAALRRDRDRARAKSDSTTAALEATRRALPPVTVPDAELRAAYARSLAVADSALAELRRKDRIIADGIRAEVKQDSTARSLRRELATVSGQLANVTQQAANWETLYNKERRRCGMKCGIVIGTLGTITVSLGIQQVRNAFAPQP